MIVFVVRIYRVSLAVILFAACGPPELPPEEWLFPPADTCAAETSGTIEQIVLLGEVDPLPLRDGDPVRPIRGPRGQDWVGIRVGFVALRGDVRCVAVEFRGDYVAEHTLSLSWWSSWLATGVIYVPVDGDELTIEAVAQGLSIRRTLVVSTFAERVPGIQRIATPTRFIASEQNDVSVFLERPATIDLSVVLDADRSFFAAPGRTVLIPAGESEARIEVRVNEPGPIRFEAWVVGDEEHRVSADADVTEAQFVAIEITPDHLQLGGGVPVRIEVRIAEPIDDGIEIALDRDDEALYSGSGHIAAGDTLGVFEVLRYSLSELTAPETIEVTVRHPDYRGFTTFTVVPQEPRAPLPGELAFNEIHWSPTTDLGCDGTVDDGDRFVEIVNVSSGWLDLAGVTINGAALDLWLVLGPHTAVVIFAGETGPTIDWPRHCIALGSTWLYDVPLARAPFEMTTAVTLELGEVVLASAEWAPDAAAPGESLQRTQDLMSWFGVAPEPVWVPHSALHEGAEPFSPGQAYGERRP